MATCTWKSGDDKGKTSDLSKREVKTSAALLGQKSRSERSRTHEAFDSHPAEPSRFEHSLKASHIFKLFIAKRCNKQCAKKFKEHNRTLKTKKI